MKRRARIYFMSSSRIKARAALMAVTLWAGAAMGSSLVHASPIAVANPLIVGGLTFTNFNCTIESAGAVSPVACGEITASALSPNSISINGPFSAVGTAAMPNANEDVALTFEVTSRTPISRVSLGFDGVASGVAIAAVTESIGTSLSALNDLGQLSVSTTDALFATIDLTMPEDVIFISKDFEFDAFSPGSSASGSIIVQDFETTMIPVPEPSSWTVFGIGLLAFAGFRYQKSKRQHPEAFHA
jgi:hypothetical protein